MTSREQVARSLETRVAETVGLLNVVSAELVSLIAEVIRTDAWKGWGIRSPEHWVVWQCGMSPSRARRLVAMARNLEELPRTPKQRAGIPWFAWVLGLAAAAAGAYFLLFYAQLAARPGQPNLQDILVASIGLVLLLEATRRAIGPILPVTAILFLGYQFLFTNTRFIRVLEYQYMTTDALFGIPAVPHDQGIAVVLEGQYFGAEKSGD